MKKIEPHTMAFYYNGVARVVTITSIDDDLEYFKGYDYVRGEYRMFSSRDIESFFRSATPSEIKGVEH